MIWNTQKKCTGLLIGAALAVLAFNYGYFFLESEILDASIETNLILIDGFKIESYLLYPLGAIVGLIILTLCHLHYHHKDLCNEFSAGYRGSKSIQSWLCQKYPEFKNTPNLGIAMGMIQGSLLNKAHDLGIIKKIGNGQQVKVSFRFDIKTHYLAVWSGIQSILGQRFWLPLYVPLLLALWALLTISI